MTKNVDRTENRWEINIHADKKKQTSNVLNICVHCIRISFVDDDCDDGKEDHLKHFRTNSKRIPQFIYHWSFENQSCLPQPRCLSMNFFDFIVILIHRLNLLRFVAFHQFLAKLLKLDFHLLISVFNSLIHVPEGNTFFVHQLHVMVHWIRM